MAAAATATRTFWQPSIILPLALVLRAGLIAYSRWHDAHSPVKYTDIDYLVFTDAARYVARGASPYARATYRYTPLLAWLLLPTAWGGWWFEFGKALFAAGDLATGYLVVCILRDRMGVDGARATKLAGIVWLLNPMVANISTRGSSEGLLAVLVVALLWAVLERRVAAAGALLGLAVHFKIYPFIYAASMYWWLGREKPGTSLIQRLFDRERVVLASTSLATFMALNGLMYAVYGMPFLEHSYAYHLIRIDHRHNFSVYNTVLHLSSLQGSHTGFRVESLAFLPQLFLAVVALPLLLGKRDLPSTMLAQTFAFVTFNKVCTSQYFLWYMVFLPFCLPSSSLLRQPRLGVTALVLWVSGQALWLQQGYELEFLGRSTFVPGLWLAGVAFFLINCWILGIIVSDIAAGGESTAKSAIQAESKKGR